MTVKRKRIVDVAATATTSDAVGTNYMLLDGPNGEKKVPANLFPLPYIGGSGITVSGRVISADTSVVATKTDLAAKQDTIADLADIRAGATAGSTAVQTETDPVFGASAAGGITSTDVGRWNRSLEVKNITSGTYDIDNADTSALYTVNTAVGSLSNAPVGLSGASSVLVSKEQANVQQVLLNRSGIYFRPGEVSGSSVTWGRWSRPLSDIQRVHLDYTATTDENYREIYCFGRESDWPKPDMLKVIVSRVDTNFDISVAIPGTSDLVGAKNRSNTFHSYGAVTSSSGNDSKVTTTSPDMYEHLNNSVTSSGTESFANFAFKPGGSNNGHGLVDSEIVYWKLDGQDNPVRTVHLHIRLFYTSIQQSSSQYIQSYGELQYWDDNR